MVRPMLEGETPVTTRVLRFPDQNGDGLTVHCLGIAEPKEWARRWLCGTVDTSLQFVPSLIRPIATSEPLPGLVDFSGIKTQFLSGYERVLATWPVAWLAVGASEDLRMPSVRRLDQMYCFGGLTERVHLDKLKQALRDAVRLASMH
jgi:hypothetical protein